MALQQVIPAFEPAVGLGTGAPRPLRRMARPMAGGFRAGGKLEELVNLIGKNYAVTVDAAAAAGKSTRLPYELAAQLGTLVVHIVPSKYLAKDLYDYVSKAFNGPYGLVLETNDPWPASGVAIAPAAVLQAKFLQQGKMVMPECILYHDEVHRSDCWTYLAAQQWGTIEGVKKYVTATATAGTGNFRKLELSGQVINRKFDAALCDQQWDVFGNVGLPWEATSMHGNTLIFEDRNEKASQLVLGYNRAGFEAFRLHSRMRESSFDAAMHSLRGDALTVLIADSTFRDGFTWPLDMIIESGRVETTVVNNGGPARCVRPVYAFEAYQGAARGGRVQGQTVTVWQPEVTFEPIRVALEQVEMDAVALVSRMLSTLVPLEADESVMAEGNVPRDLFRALTGTMPLAAFTDTQLAPLTSSGYVRAPSPVTRDVPALREYGSDYRHPGMSADLANRRDFQTGFGESPQSSPSHSRESSVSTSTTATSVVSDLGSWLAELSMEAPDMVPGHYYFSPTVQMDRVASAALPEGWLSVVRSFGDDESTAHARDLHPSAREVAVAAGLQKFNTLSCELNAIGSVTRDVQALGRDRSPPLVRRWLHQLMERMTTVRTEMATVMRLLIPFVSGFCRLEEVPQDSLVAECQGMATHIVESLRAIPVAGTSASMAADVIRNSVRVPEARALDAQPTMSVAAPDHKYVDMHRRGKTSRPKPPLTPFTRWVVGTSINPAVKRLASKHDHHFS